MSEQEWLACWDSNRMLVFLRNQASDRKLRLLACACCRRMWHLLTDPRSQRAVEVGERYADGQITDRVEISSVEQSATQAGREFYRTGRRAAAMAAALAAWTAEVGPGGFFVAKQVVVFAALLHILDLEHGWENVPEVEEAVRLKTLHTNMHQINLVRDLFGPLPFRSIAIDRSWLAWNDCTIPKIAQAIYDERAFERLPILADALDEAGCTNADMLNHCRQPGEHVRGCWVVDLLLGKS